MARTLSIRSLWPAMVAVASLSLALGVLPARAEVPSSPGDIQARVAGSQVTLDGWPDGAELTVDVGGAVYTTTVSAGEQSRVDDVQLAPGTWITVEVTGGPGLGLSNEMQVGPLAVTEVDYDNDLVHGVALRSVADPNAWGTWVQVCAALWPGSGTGQGSCRWVQTDQTVPTTGDYGTGLTTWTADFSDPAPGQGGTGTEPALDLQPYWMGIEASQQAVPIGTVQNRTTNSPGQYPYLDVQFRSDWDPPASGDAVALGFDIGTGVSFRLLRDGQQVCSQDVEVSPPGDDPNGWYRWLSYATFDVWADDCNPQPGDVLVGDGTYLGRPLTKQLVVVTPRTADGSMGVDADVVGNVISGVVPAGDDVEVGAWDGGSVSVVVPDGSTTFAADMALAEPPYDVQPWSWFGVQVFDPEGDVVDTQLRAMPLVFGVEPTTDLVGGQTVTLTGENFAPGPAAVMQGWGFIGGLDESTATEITVGDDGSFTATYQLQQFLNVPTGPEHEDYVDVDCGTASEEGGPCFVAVMQDPDWAQQDTSFLPAEVGLTLNPTGTLSKAGGRVTVAGSVSCTTLQGSVQVEGTLTQRIGRKSLATGSFTLVADCPDGTWSASVTPSGTIPFGTGAAELRATATLMAGSWDVQQSAVRTITVKATKK